MGEIVVKNSNAFWRLVAGYDTYQRSQGHARLDTPWNAFTQDNKRLICTLWEDLVVDIDDRTTGSERRFVRLGGRLRNWKTVSIKHGREAADNIQKALEDRAIQIVGYEAAPDERKLTQSIRSVKAFYPERCHLLKPWFGVRGEELTDRLKLNTAFANLPGDRNADVADYGTLFELTPMHERPALDAASEEQLLDVMDRDELEQFAQRQVNEERKKPLNERAARLASVAAFTRARASSGFCELCDRPTFQTARGSAYLESHHIISLAQRGEDDPENTAALCPMCHREAHHAPEQRRQEIRVKLQVIRRNARCL